MEVLSREVLMGERPPVQVHRLRRVLLLEQVETLFGSRGIDPRKVGGIGWLLLVLLMIGKALEVGRERFDRYILKSDPDVMARVRPITNEWIIIPIWRT